MGTPINIAGTISYCPSAIHGPVPNVTLALTGDATDSTVTDGLGSYGFSSLAAGGSYTVTPSKGALAPSGPGIDTFDVIATQRHFLQIALLSRCRLAAADVNGDTAVNTFDVIAIQRFYLGLTTGIDNVGKYQFTPENRAYPVVVSDQTDQSYNTLVFGDTAAPFVEPLDGALQTATGNDGMSAPDSVTPRPSQRQRVDRISTRFRQ